MKKTTKPAKPTLLLSLEKTRELTPDHLKAIVGGALSCGGLSCQVSGR